MGLRESHLINISKLRVFLIRQIQKVIRKRIRRSRWHTCSSLVAFPVLVIQVSTGHSISPHSFNVEIKGDSHHDEFNRNHKGDADVKGSKASGVARRLALEEEVRSDDLTNTVGHEHHYLERVSKGIAI